EVIDNGIDKEVIDEVRKDDVEVEGNQSKDSKEDAENKKCWLISNDIVKGVVWKPMVKMRMNGIIMSGNYCMCCIRKEGEENMAYFVSKTTLASKDLSIKKIKSCWVVSDNRCKGSEVTDETKIKDDTQGKLVLLCQPSLHLREFLTSSLSVTAGKDLETENGSSRASLVAMKTMLENGIGSVKRIRGDKEDCILESQDKKVDNDVKEIRKRSCLSNLIFGDDDMNLSFQNINSDCVVMGVNEFVVGANRSEGNLVLRSNSKVFS
nr:hypothetical protein [Tanacetum cinerariifolium]